MTSLSSLVFEPFSQEMSFQQNPKCVEHAKASPSTSTASMIDSEGLAMNEDSIPSTSSIHEECHKDVKSVLSPIVLQNDTNLLGLLASAAVESPRSNISPSDICKKVDPHVLSAGVSLLSISKLDQKRKMLEENQGLEWQSSDVVQDAALLHRVRRFSMGSENDNKTKSRPRTSSINFPVNQNQFDREYRYGIRDKRILVEKEEKEEKKHTMVTRSSIKKTRACSFSGISRASDTNTSEKSDSQSEDDQDVMDAPKPSSVKLESFQEIEETEISESEQNDESAQDKINKLGNERKRKTCAGLYTPQERAAKIRKFVDRRKYRKWTKKVSCKKKKGKKERKNIGFYK